LQPAGALLFPPYVNDATRLGDTVGGAAPTEERDTPCVSVEGPPVGRSDFTFSAWVRPDPDVPLRGQQCLFAKERCAVGSNQFRMLLSPGGQVDVWMEGLEVGPPGTAVAARLVAAGAPRDNNSYCISLFSTARLARGRWAHVAFSRRNGVFSLWVNGVLQREDGAAGTASDHQSPEPYVIGGRPSPPHRGYLAIPPPHVDVFAGRMVCAGFTWQAAGGGDVMGWVGWARRRVAVIGCALADW
jgi:hypothetical protein